MTGRLTSEFLNHHRAGVVSPVDEYFVASDHYPCHSRTKCKLHQLPPNRCHFATIPSRSHSQSNTIAAAKNTQSSSKSRKPSYISSAMMSTTLGRSSARPKAADSSSKATTVRHSGRLRKVGERLLESFNVICRGNRFFVVELVRSPGPGLCGPNTWTASVTRGFLIGEGQCHFLEDGFGFVLRGIGQSQLNLKSVAGRKVGQVQPGRSFGDLL